MKKILVAEDEQNIREFVVINLKRAGYDCVEAASGEEALRVYEQAGGDFDVAVLDIMMPGSLDGLAVCKELRQKNATIGIIMLTAKTQEMDKVTGLMMGADDYVTKPFNPVELQARVKSQIRRYMLLGSGQKVRTKLSAGGIELDDKLKEVTLDGEPVNLTRTEYDILKLLMEHPGEVYSPKQIYEAVWKGSPCGVENTVAVHIRHLREKLEYNPAEPRYLKVVWGRGYKMEDVENE